MNDSGAEEVKSTDEQPEAEQVKEHQHPEPYRSPLEEDTAPLNAPQPLPDNPERELL